MKIEIKKVLNDDVEIEILVDVRIEDDDVILEMHEATYRIPREVFTGIGI